MSGIVGFVNTDGAPADAILLRNLTAAMAYRGPDALHTWTRGETGLGHALLLTSPENAPFHQPCTVDGRAWITADCRLDDREALISKLAGKGCGNAASAHDAELILHAWAVWGDDCVLHLLGDFSFAIWDVERKRLFCARDHLGVKLFYFAQTRQSFVFGNTLTTLFGHPAVDRSALNERSVGDYLLFGYHIQTDDTFFRDINSLHAAHTLSLVDGKVEIRRYWTLPVDPPLRLRRRAEYTEVFLSLLETATRDRLPDGNLAILMSGGLDSSGLAAMAQKLAGQRSGLTVEGHTCVFDSLIPDPERHFAGVVADHLKIPVKWHPRDDEQFLQSSSRHSSLLRPSPVHLNLLGPDPRDGFMGSVANCARVAFYGEGPDNALDYEPVAYFRHELRRGQIPSLIRDLLTFPFLFGELPLMGRFTMARFNMARFKAPQSGQSGVRPETATDAIGLPSWLNPDFAAAHDLSNRWKNADALRGSASAQHPVRPVSWGSFHALEWFFILEGMDPGVTGVPLEVRHPYLDVRLLRFMLSVPAMPWCRNKSLMRKALRGLLPAEVTTRPKFALAGDPALERWRLSGLPSLPDAPQLDRYIDVDSFRPTAVDSSAKLAEWIRVAGLTLFLRNTQAPCDNLLYLQ